MTTRYTEDHEWARDEDGLIVVGITNFAQEQLGEVVFVELPDVDSEINAGDEAAVVESVKAAGEVKAPVSGTVAAVNEALVDNPEKVNEDPSGDGWFYKLKSANPEEFDNLMSDASYQELLETLA